MRMRGTSSVTATITALRPMATRGCTPVIPRSRRPQREAREPRPRDPLEYPLEDLAEVTGVDRGDLRQERAPGRSAARSRSCRPGASPQGMIPAK